MNVKHLGYMVDQIARNFAAQGEDFAIDATAHHLIEYWDPRMKAAILAADANGLTIIAQRAIARLRTLSESHA